MLTEAIIPITGSHNFLADPQGASKNPLASEVNLFLNEIYGHLTNDPSPENALNQSLSLTKFFRLYWELAAAKGYDYFQAPFDECNVRCIKAAQALAADKNFLEILTPTVSIINIEMNETIEQVMEKSTTFHPKNYLLLQNNKMISIPELINVANNNPSKLFEKNTDGTYGQYQLTATDMINLRNCAGIASKAIYNALDSIYREYYLSYTLDELLRNLVEKFLSTEWQSTWQVEPRAKQKFFRKFYDKWLTIPETERTQLEAVRLPNSILFKKLLSSLFAHVQIDSFLSEPINPLINTPFEVAEVLGNFIKLMENDTLLNQILSTKRAPQTVLQKPEVKLSAGICLRFSNNLSNTDVRSHTASSMEEESNNAHFIFSKKILEVYRKTSELEEFANKNHFVTLNEAFIEELLPTITRHEELLYLLKLGNEKYFPVDVNSLLLAVIKRNNLQKIFPTFTLLQEALAKLPMKADIFIATALKEYYFGNKEVNPEELEKIAPYFTEQAYVNLKPLEERTFTLEKNKALPPSEYQKSLISLQQILKPQNHANNDLAPVVNQFFDNFYKNISHVNNEADFSKILSQFESFLKLYAKLILRSNYDYLHAPFEQCNLRCLQIAEIIAKHKNVNALEVLFPGVTLPQFTQKSNKRNSLSKIQLQDFYLLEKEDVLISVKKLMQEAYEKPSILFRENEDKTFGIYHLSQQDMSNISRFTGDSSKSLFNAFKAYYSNDTQPPATETLYSDFERELFGSVRAYQKASLPQTQEHFTFCKNLIQADYEILEGKNEIDHLIPCVKNGCNLLSILSLRKQNYFSFEHKVFFHALIRHKRDQLLTIFPRNILKEIFSFLPDLDMQEDLALALGQNYWQSVYNPKMDLSYLAPNVQMTIELLGKKVEGIRRKPEKPEHSLNTNKITLANAGQHILFGKTGARVVSQPSLYSISKAASLLGKANLRKNDPIALQIAKAFEAYANPKFYWLTWHTPERQGVAAGIAKILRANQQYTYEQCVDYIEEHLKTVGKRKHEFTEGKGTFHGIVQIIYLLKDNAQNENAKNSEVWQKKISQF